MIRRIARIVVRVGAGLAAWALTRNDWAVVAATLAAWEAFNVAYDVHARRGPASVA